MAKFSKQIDLSPNDFKINRTMTAAVAPPRTIRKQTVVGLTSAPAGKMVPITAIPVLREEAIRSGRIQYQIEMMETVEIVMNPIHVRFMAYFVPHLALDRFDGMDALNRSHEGKEAMAGQPVIPYIETGAAPAHGINLIHKYLGRHTNPGDLVNSSYTESYNQIWNFRARNRSPKLTLRGRLDNTTLAPAFWNHERFRHIVPDFDQAKMDGEVPLNITAGQLLVKGIGWSTSKSFEAAGTVIQKTDGTQETTVATAGQRWSSNRPFYKEDPANIGFPKIWSELEENGITVSLSNIELAKKTAAWAEIRSQYTGHTDDYIIDLLLQGVTIPEQAFRQPMLVGQKETVFGMSKRYSSDADALTESVVNGATMLDMSIQLPRQPVGGVIMVVMEVTPQQLFERQRDPWLYAQNVNDLPNYMRDDLDPEKVEVVTNGMIDTSHASPNGQFGFAPLSHKWNTDQPTIGGKFFRPTVNTAFDEDRQRIWAVETINPTLSTDFYLCTGIHQKPFVVTNVDPFEVVSNGEVFIEGHTVFGRELREASDDYEKVLAEAPQDRIVKAP